ncbi:hypothetical protein GTY65_00140 [Streptomyces sp. SID8379]|nr:MULTISPECIES: hypothetical protein [unclassified Streptomyces]MYW62500.1 hypothetical protein [Streptomyces sp. SID8379]
MIRRVARPEPVQPGCPFEAFPLGTVAVLLLGGAAGEAAAHRARPR